MLPAGLIITVHRIGQKDLVQDGKAAGVAGAHAEHHKILRFAAGIDDFNFFTFHLEVHKVLSLGEEEVFGAADGVEGPAEGIALGPLLILSLAGIVVHRQVKGFFGSQGGEEIV